MTLLDAISTVPVHAVEHQLADSLNRVPGAVALVASTGVDGLSGLCLIDGGARNFYEIEAVALGALLETRRAHPDTYVDLLCINLADAEGMEFPDEDARVYRFA